MANLGVPNNPIRKGQEDGVELKPGGVVNMPAQYLSSTHAYVRRPVLVVRGSPLQLLKICILVYLRYGVLQPVEEYYYKKDVNLVNDQIGGFPTNAQGSNSDNWSQGRNYGNNNYTTLGIMVRECLVNCNRLISSGIWPPLTNRRLWSVTNLLTIICYVGNHSVDYSLPFHRRTVLHIRGYNIRDPKMGIVTYGGYPRAVTPSTDRRNQVVFHKYHGTETSSRLHKEGKVKVRHPVQPHDYELHLYTVPIIEELLKRHKCEWMEQSAVRSAVQCCFADRFGDSSI
uniref:Uncharacterized protein n=1 Tax=Solanum tuberosum TaxID=4113 RepID=M1DGY9_SOLTU